MGKTVGKILKVVGAIALGVVTLNPTVPLAFLGSAMAATTLSAFGAGAIVAGTLLDPPQVNAAAMSEQGGVLQLKTASIEPRQLLYGLAGTAGVMLYRESTGAENEYLHLVIGLAGHKTTSLEGFKFGDESVSFDGSGGAIGTYAGKMNLNFYDGDVSQTADVNLVSASAKWTANHRLSGISYAYIRLKWDHETYPQGMETPHFKLKGRKLYDPRKDSTNGGVGSHRLDDELTWEWSDNPVLAMIDYLIGIKIGGNLIAGMGVLHTRVDWPNIIAEANICDENVALKAGGTEPRYTASGWINPNQTHRDNINTIASACGGSLVFQSGKWRCYVAAQRAAVKARGADDVIGTVSMQAKKSISQKVNSIRGVYIDPSQDFEPVDFPPLQNQTYISEDGGGELWKDVNLPFTKSHSMAQRLAKIALGRARMEKVIKANFTLASLQDQAMDTIGFSHDRFNILNQNMVCADWRLAVAQTKDGGEGLIIECTLVEDSADIYAWSALDDEQEIIPSDSVVTNNRRFPDLANLEGKLDFQDRIYARSVDGSWTVDDEMTVDREGKPNDQATNNIVFRQPDAPSTNIASDDDIWVDTDSVNNKTYQMKLGVWGLMATEGADANVNLRDEGGDLLTDNIVKNNNTIWEDVSGKIPSAPLVLPPEAVLNDGGGVFRRVPMGITVGDAYDGDVVSFPSVWDASNLPKVEFYAGGLAYDSGGTLTGDQIQSFNALSLSASGFTAELKLQGTATTITPRSDTGAVETSTNVWELHKALAADAWNDQYTFQIDVNVKGVFNYLSTLVVGFYTNDGAGWVQRTTRSYDNDSFIAGSDQAYLNQTATVTVDGLGNHAGYEYKVLIENSTHASSSIDAFDSSSYDEASSAPTKISATPVGVSPIKYIVKGGVE